MIAARLIGAAACAVALVMSTLQEAPAPPAHLAPSSAPFQFQDATLGMSLDAFKRLKAGDAVIHSVLEKDKRGKFKPVTRALPTPLCSDTIPAIATPPASDGEIVCDVYFGEKYRDDLVVAGQSVDSIRYFFRGQRLASIHLEFSDLSFRTIVEAFDTKYGKHDAEKDIPLQNGFGATWVGKEIAWNRGIYQLTVWERNGPASSAISWKHGQAFAIFQDLANQPPRPKPPIDF